MKSYTYVVYRTDEQGNLIYRFEAPNHRAAAKYIMDQTRKAVKSGVSPLDFSVCCVMPSGGQVSILRKEGDVIKIEYCQPTGKPVRRETITL